MRATLEIADHVLLPLRELAKRHRKTADQLLSESARRPLSVPSHGTRAPRRKVESREFLRFRPIAGRGGLVTNEVVNRL